MKESELDPVARQLRSNASRLQIQEELQQVEAALDELSDAHREVILLRSYEASRVAPSA